MLRLSLSEKRRAKKRTWKDGHIGASGKFLNAMLEQAGMKREDVYITNIVKYRPPENRDPTAAEKAAFLPYLLRQIEIISPKVIITLGRHSMEQFMSDAKISEVHGQLFSITVSGATLALIPLFHPAAALFNGGKRQTLFDDFAKVPSLISSQHIAK
jgi:DNA polymerase